MAGRARPPAGAHRHHGGAAAASTALSRRSRPGRPGGFRAWRRKKAMRVSPTGNGTPAGGRLRPMPQAKRARPVAEGEIDQGRGMHGACRRGAGRAAPHAILETPPPGPFSAKQGVWSRFISAGARAAPGPRFCPVPPGPCLVPFPVVCRACCFVTFPVGRICVLLLLC